MTERELEIAHLIAAGLRDSEIAAELGFSVRTIKECKHRAARRMGYKGKRVDVFLVRTVYGTVLSQSRLERFGPKLRGAAELAALGLTNREIAAKLRLAVETIRNYMREVYDLAGVWNRRELAGWLLGRTEKVKTAFEGQPRSLSVGCSEPTMPPQSCESNLPVPSCSPRRW